VDAGCADSSHSVAGDVLTSLTRHITEAGRPGHPATAQAREFRGGQGLTQVETLTLRARQLLQAC
jgi:hypothetical protein